MQQGVVGKQQDGTHLQTQLLVRCGQPLQHLLRGLGDLAVRHHQDVGLEAGGDVEEGLGS